MKINKKFIYLYGLSCGTIAMIQTIHNSYWSVFLTTAAGLSTAGMALILSIVGIADIVSVLLVSVLVQKSNLKFGKFRFWILIGGLGAAVTRVLAFSTFMQGSVAYFAIMIVLSSAFFNLAYCAYMGMLPVVSDTQEGRLKASSVQQQSVAVFAIILAVIGVAVIQKFSFAVLSGIAAVAIFATFIPLYISSKKIDVYTPTEKMTDIEKALQPSLWDMIRLTFNMPMLIYLIGDVCRTAAALVIAMTMAYYYTFVYGDMSLLTYYLTLSTVMQLLGASLAPYMSKLVKGSRNTFAAGMFIYAIMLALSLVVGGSMLLATIAFSIGFLGWAVTHTTSAAYYSHIGDYVEYKHGKNIQPFLMSMLSLLIKFGQGLAAVIVGWGLVAIGFDANQITDSAINGLKYIVIVIPLALLIVGGFITFLSPLSDKRIKEIRTELDRRHAADEDKEPAAN